MATKKFTYLTYLDAVELHFELMRFYKENRFGVFDKSLIESALARPKHAAFYDNADIFRQAATLSFGLIKNHPWLVGNKRTATHLTEVFLELNGIYLDYKLIDVIELSLNIEADVWKIDQIEKWFKIKKSS